MPQFPFTPSHLPDHARQGHVRKLALALKTEDPNGVDMGGNTALHVVMGMKPGQAATMIGLLAAAGADLNRRNEQGETPMTLALKRGMSLEHLTALIDAGVDLAVTNQDLSTPLIQALHKLNTDAFDLLLARGAPVETESQDRWTTLHVAASLTVSDHYIQALLAAGANPFLTDSFQRSVFDVMRGPNVAVLNAWRVAHDQKVLTQTLQAVLDDDQRATTAPRPRL